jgi:hypothetical protein
MLFSSQTSRSASCQAVTIMFTTIPIRWSKASSAAGIGWQLNRAGGDPMNGLFRDRQHIAMTEAPLGF